MSAAEQRQLPYKVWSCNRETRKAVMASSLSDLRVKGAEKLGYNNPSELKVVLESDGTEVEDENYFKTVEKDTIFILLRPGERWFPPSMETLRAAITAIPRIVCEAINSLELVDKQPSWKIMDNKGRITVVLNWDQRDTHRPPGHQPSSRQGPMWRVEVTSQEAQTADQTTAGTKDLSAQRGARAKLSLEGLGPRPPSRTLPKKPPEKENEDLPEEEVAAGPSGVDVQRKAGKGHVRFLNVTQESKIPQLDESESDTENTAYEEEQLSERYLLLMDQLSLEQNRHLSVKDIGVILERLSSKIVDVDKLEREKESTEVYNWTIKATIRGEVLREIGVIYNGQYYGIMEHPGYF
ncbi:uncharacterized protein LOC106468429 [Limulus polyphemus]|uniref:Uncharacterized protein LOC106468429 n=1 Tax=Limulus polyphemus TaxID=6850 RepID=A0ABM1T9B3_LIMPO|nr:uncharacterized protein LOC106468429 [Limulus polyphemus]